VDQESLRIGDFEIKSRLFVGTGKYETFELMRDALAASGCEVVTVAVRRERLMDSTGRNILDFLDPEKYTLLPNTAGCFNAEETIRTARLGRELLEGLGNKGAGWVKLEVLGDKKTLLPDPVGTLEALKVLKTEGFTVLCYTSDDPVMAVRLKEGGAHSVMPAGSPIGSGQGILNPYNIRIILEQLKAGDPDYPVIVDAGVGTASDVTIAMELGADGVLLNTGIAGAKDPVRMAHSMKLHETRSRIRLPRPTRRTHPAQALRHRNVPAGRGDRSGRIVDRRTKICIWIILIGLGNFLIYVLLYIHIDGEAVNGSVKTIEGQTRYFLQSDTEVSRGVYIYSGVHSISIWITVAGIMLAMLTLAKERIVSSMRSAIVRGRTFITILATIIAFITIIMTVWFVLQFASRLAHPENPAPTTQVARNAPER
jgi:thiazole synthase